MATQDYPYSALFDIDKLKAEEEARKAQLQSSQAKIMKTNAVGDAFRLLFDAIGGSQGASITPKAINPGIMKASQRYNALEDQSTANMDRLRLQDLAMKEKDVQYGLGQKANDEAFGRQKELLKMQEGVRTRESAAESMRKMNETAAAQKYADLSREDQQAFQERMAKVNSQADMNRIKYGTDEDIRQYEATTAKYGYGLKSATRTDRTKAMAKDDLLFQVPGTNQKIYIGKEELQEMAYRLIDEGVNTPALMSLKLNGVLRTTSLLQDIKTYWDIAKEVLPDLATPQQPAPSTPLLPGYQAPQAVPYQQGQGPLRSYGTPQPARQQAVAPTAAMPQAENTDIIKRDKKGVLDFSELDL